jgi:hypothetical protein
VIASQALISGAFSLAAQAIRLGLFPRLQLLHTHERHAGQVYVPFVNWSLFIGCVLLVATFGSSSALGAAYGLAVAGVMVITSIAMFRIARLYWKWRPVAIGLVWGLLPGSQCRISDRKPAQVRGRRLCSRVNRRGVVLGNGELALGPQSNLCRLFSKINDDHRRID